MRCCCVLWAAVLLAASRAAVQDDCEFLDTECPPTLQYRPVDGSCNNPRYPWLGRANSPLYRILRPAYADGQGAPRRGHRGQPLPSAQEIVSRLMPQVQHESITSHLFVIWGQLLSHDVARIEAPKNQATGPCCDGGGRGADDTCFPIPVPFDDPFYRQFDVRCLPLSRTNSSTCRSPHPEQMTSVTHFLDASFLYGSDEAEAARLRSGEGGQLRARAVDDGWGEFGQFPPSDAGSADLCATTSTKTAPCYHTGDERANQNPMLAGLHTLFLREHNRVAGLLAGLNPHWGDERTYQEARRVVVAQWQVIVYRDWLRWLLGEDRVRRLGLVPRGATPRSQYLADVDPRTANDVTTAGFRALHSMVQGRFWLGGRGRRAETFSRWFDNSAPLLERPGGLLAVLQGLVHQQAQDLDRWMDDEMTTQYEPSTTRDGRQWGNDLAAVDIQRGRDHGLPSYVEYRRHAGLPEASDFEDLLDTISWQDVSDLRRVYAHVRDVDYYVGGLMERRAPGASLFGPTFQELLEDQFWRWRFADRFFYNFVGFAHSFREEQILALEGTSVGRLLCDNVAGFDFVPRDPFVKVGHRGNEIVSCDNLSKVDFSCLWRENRDGTYGCQESHENMNPWDHEKMGPWNQEKVDSWDHEKMDSWDHEKTDSWDHEKTDSWDHEEMGPWDKEKMNAWDHEKTNPWDQEKMNAWDREKTNPWDHRWRRAA